MTPKEKAQKLVNKFLQANEGHFYQVMEADTFDAAKECALVAVDEILDATQNLYVTGTESYWLEVKQEIEKL